MRTAPPNRLSTAGYAAARLIPRCWLRPPAIDGMSLQSGTARTKDPLHVPPDPRPRPVAWRALSALAGAGLAQTRDRADWFPAVEGPVLGGGDHRACADRDRLRHGAHATAPAVCAVRVVETLERAVHAGCVRAGGGGLRAAQSPESEDWPSDAGRHEAVGARPFAGDRLRA